MDYYARDECLGALRRSDSEVPKAQGHAPLRPRSDLWTVLLDMERRGEPAAHKDLLVSSRELSACYRKGQWSSPVPRKRGLGIAVCCEALLYAIFGNYSDTR
ncbi:hypothetical protein EYF80_017366 [Liparis tanakae]|uniref:Uncharacterized protein n=1 Tax=Liparis tanakae TaxID=230148 RepID=A0A4Z2I3P6_9TELE|nr:hypothetical protein EYF80_017366 [Liparis tanakae]